MRVVFDTNVLVSHLLFPLSEPGRAVREALTNHTLLVSEGTLAELASVLARPKCDTYLSAQERQAFVRAFESIAEAVVILERVRVCRDARDHKFLEVAINGRADVIVTGDSDLLVLNPFRRVAIVTTAQYTSGSRT